jgi:hypothetical protein
MCRWKEGNSDVLEDSDAKEPREIMQLEVNTFAKDPVLDEDLVDKVATGQRKELKAVETQEMVGAFVDGARERPSRCHVCLVQLNDGRSPR